MSDKIEGYPADIVNDDWDKMSEGETVSFYTPPPFRVCPECEGEGLFQDGPEVEDCFACKNCYGTGQIPIYYTIPQWEELTGREVPDDMPVWELQLDWINGGENWYARIKDMVYPTNTMIIATEAGRPPKDWRPE